MKCSNCGETLKDDAKVCFKCGEAVLKNDIDTIIDDMIKEDEALEKKTTTVKPKKKIDKPKTEISNGKSSDSSKVYHKKPGFSKATRIIAYVNIAIILTLLMSMLFSWFAFSGRGMYKGFEKDQENKQFMTEEVISLNDEQMEALDVNVELVKFSPRDLVVYAKNNKDMYLTLKNNKGEDKKSFALMINLIYIKAFYLIIALGLLSILLLVIDRNLKTIEWTRGISAFSVVIIALNYVVLKIPFFSIFALKARSLLRTEEPLSAVTLNMNGINVNNDFYPYVLNEQNAFFIAVTACVLWFVFSTVLVEMKKDKEFK